MARYTIYYSTKPHIKEYEDYLENPDNYNEFNTPEEPVKIRLIRATISDEIKKDLDEKLANYEISKEEYNELYIKERNKKLEDKFNKYEVDSILSSFKSEEEFLDKLSGSKTINHEKVIETSKNGRQNRIIVEYKNRGQRKELSKIYNNKMLQKIATQFAIRKANGKNPDELILTDEIKEEYYLYIEQVVESYLRDRSYMNALANMFRKTAKYNPVHASIVADIESFYENSTAKKEKLEKGDESEMIAINQELDTCTRNFARYLKDYDTFRKVALWEQDVRKKELSRKKEEETEEFIQQEFDLDDLFKKDPEKYQEIVNQEIKQELIKEIEEVAKIAEQEAKENNRSLVAGPKRELLKRFTSGQLNFMSQEFLDKYKINIDSLKKQEETEARKEYKESKKIIKEYQDDKIYSYYSEGGSNAVIENIDLDELITYPREVLEDVGINVDGLGLNNDGDPITDGKRK
ncbi:MAG: hypothetical protein IJF92_01250 [Bacilli bacterium]|nr:hypothetical protein [Bacilli bacterium]